MAVILMRDMETEPPLVETQIQIMDHLADFQDVTHMTMRKGSRRTKKIQKSVRRETLSVTDIIMKL